jgi:hypothetical protein
LAAARGELHVNGQGQHARLRDDVLEVLVLLNDIGMRNARLTGPARWESLMNV